MFLYLVCVNPQVLEPANFFHRFSIHLLYVGLLSCLDAVDENFAFVLADFHAVISSRFLQSFSELSAFFFTVSQKTDVISNYNRPSKQGD